MRTSQQLKKLCESIFIIAVAGCSGSTSDESPTAPWQPVLVEPFKMTINQGNGQTVAVGTMVDTPPAVLIEDATGQFVAGVTVTFRVTGGDGYLNGNSSTTSVSTVSAYGSVPHVDWTLGPLPGWNILTVTADKVRDTLTFSAIATTPLPFMQSLTRITAGWDHTCGLTQDGTAYCWGSNSKGQIGNNGSKDSVFVTPTQVAGGLKFAELSAGNFHTCGVTVTDRAYCWGYNEWGQLGDGTRVDRFTPVAVLGPNFKTISAGGGRTNFADVAHTCALTAQGAAYCWGYNGYGEAGTGIAGNLWLKPEGLVSGISFRSLSSGGFHTCGVAISGESYCWGSDTNGQLGLGTATVIQPAPIRVSGDHVFQTLSAGPANTCGSTSSGFYCWGLNNSGQLGDGTFVPRLAPTSVGAPLAFQNAALGLFHTCARTSAGVAYCWGWNWYRQLGAGSRNDFETAPLPVQTNVLFDRLAAGSGHTCGISTSGAAYCWGSNQYGELGDGTRIGRFTPVRVRTK